MERNLIKIQEAGNAPAVLLRSIFIKSNFSYQLLVSAFSLDHLIELCSYSETFDNELLMKLLCSCYGIKRLTANKTRVKIFEYSSIEDYLEVGYFMYKATDGSNNIALTSLKYLPEFVELKCLPKISLLNYKDFIYFFENNFSHLNLIRSKYYLKFTTQAVTAKDINYAKSITGFIIIFFAIVTQFANSFHVINNIAYFTQNSLKIFLVTKALNKDDSDLIKITPQGLPIYTILIPLYKEAEKIDAVIEFIQKFNYPKHSLDAKIVVEADDIDLLAKISTYILPSYIQIIKVPYSLPRTKPKALNYALPYCRGEYIVVYDAEDQPDPDQLLTAVEAFESLPQEYACVQGKLNFYNAEENLLTKFFSIEYSMWFNYMLKGLSLLELPITLGGTSNHFKTKILKEIGGWDAYNVTEDAELGVRLSTFGYKVFLIDSYTLEEAPVSVGTWLKQRSRWIKGFVQTFFTFLGMKKKLSVMSFRQLATIYILVGASTYSYWSLPWLFIMVIKCKSPWFSYLWLINSFFTFAYMYASAYHILLKSKGSIKRFERLDYCGILLFPFYFALHTIASYMAIWESLRDPFKWNKTAHGLSSFNKVEIYKKLEGNSITNNVQQNDER